MADFNSAVITDVGAELLANVMASSGKIEFTALSIGDGTYTEEEKEIDVMRTMTELKSERLSFSFSSVTPYSDTAVRLKALVSNIEVTTGFYINEVGIWAKDADSTGATPVLYSIVTAETADYLPAYNGSVPSTIEQDWYTTLSNEAEASITIDSSAYASVSDFEEFKEYVINAIADFDTVDIVSEEEVTDLIEDLMDGSVDPSGDIATDEEVEEAIENLDDL